MGASEQSEERTAPAATGAEQSDAIQKATSEALAVAASRALGKIGFHDTIGASRSPESFGMFASRSHVPPATEEIDMHIAQIEANLSNLKKDVAEFKVQARGHEKLRIVMSVWSYATGAFVVAGATLWWLSGVISILVPIAIIWLAAGAIGTLLASSKLPKGETASRDAGGGTNSPVEGIFR
jgi:hypothetical protein